MSVSSLAKAGYITAESTTLANEPPPTFTHIKEQLQTPDYTLPYPRTNEITPQAILRAATTQGQIDLCTDEMERFIHVLGTTGEDEGGELETKLLAPLLAELDRHPDILAALREAEDAVASGSHLQPASVLGKLVGISNRQWNAQARQATSVTAQIKNCASLAFNFLQSNTAAKHEAMESFQHPDEWTKYIQELSASSRESFMPGSTPVERLISSTAESLILSLQNEQISRSNAALARIAERAAALARQQQERAERAERERVEAQTKLAEARAKERADRLEKERLKREAEMEQKARMEKAQQERLRLDQLKAESEAVAAAASLTVEDEEVADETADAAAVSGPSSPSRTSTVDLVSDDDQAAGSITTSKSTSTTERRSSTRKRRRTLTDESNDEDEEFEDDQQQLEASPETELQFDASTAPAIKPTSANKSDSSVFMDEDDSLPLSSLLSSTHPSTAAPDTASGAVSFPSPTVPESVEDFESSVHLLMREDENEEEDTTEVDEVIEGRKKIRSSKRQKK